MIPLFQFFRYINLESTGEFFKMDASGIIKVDKLYVSSTNN